MIFRFQWYIISYIFFSFAIIGRKNLNRKDKIFITLIPTKKRQKTFQTHKKPLPNPPRAPPPFIVKNCPQTPKIPNNQPKITFIIKVEKDNKINLHESVTIQRSYLYLTQQPPRTSIPWQNSKTSPNMITPLVPPSSK